MTELTLNKELLKQQLREIEEIDLKLDSAAGSTVAGKRRITSTLREEFQPRFQNNVQEIVKWVSSQEEPRQLTAAYSLVVSALEEAVGEKVENFLDRTVAENKELARASLSKEELADLQELRKQKLQEFKALKVVLGMTLGEQEVEDIPDPKTRRGGRGPRGPRTLSQYQYSINDVELVGDANSLRQVASMCGGIKVSELKEWLTKYAEPKEGKEEFDLKNPPDEWEAMLPNDTVLKASKFEQYRDGSSEDEDEDEEDEEEEEEEREF